LKKNKVKKSTKYGIIGSGISCSIVLLLLLFIVFPTLKTEEKEDEGLMVSFGNNLNGSGMTDIPTNVPRETQLPNKPINAEKEDVMTQSDK